MMLVFFGLLGFFTPLLVVSFLAHFYEEEERDRSESRSMGDL